MKKTTLFALIVVGLTVSFFVSKSSAQEQTPARKVLQKAQQQKRIFGGIGLIDDTQDIIKTQSLRNEYLRLVQLHLQTMNDKELFAEIAHLRKELHGEHEVKSKLRPEKFLQVIRSVNASDSKTDSKPEKTEVKKGTTVIRKVEKKTRTETRNQRKNKRKLQKN